jgi:hypothetical protein
MKQLIYILLVGILVSVSSCRTDFETVDSTGTLEFSKSKIFLDTVFNNIGSSTYRLTSVAKILKFQPYYWPKAQHQNTD